MEDREITSENISKFVDDLIAFSPFCREPEAKLFGAVIKQALVDANEELSEDLLLSTKKEDHIRYTDWVNTRRWLIEKQFALYTRKLHLNEEFIWSLIQKAFPWARETEEEDEVLFDFEEHESAPLPVLFGYRQANASNFPCEYL